MSGVSTVKIVDKRIEPQGPPVYATTVGPVQNQFYSVPASGLSNSYITFNNLTTLGADRAYLDTFEVELTAKITLNTSAEYSAKARAWEDAVERRDLTPFSRYTWTFESFPFNKVCEECRVNVNGGAFFSSPLSYLRAKERYWDQDAIQKAYGGICPCNKAIAQNEVGYAYAKEPTNAQLRVNPHPYLVNQAGNLVDVTDETWAAKKVVAYLPHTGTVPSRLTTDSFNRSTSGINSNPNNMLVPESMVTGLDGHIVEEVFVTWREPIFASPFSSRIDATYGRPLYNITSLDIAFNLQDLRNMLLVANPYITSYTVDITAANLCYQVETVPVGIAPPMTVVPYRRFVPYITDLKEEISADRKVKMKSGVYTLNEVPTAIWIFAGPTKAMIQNYSPDTYLFSTGDGAANTVSVTLPNSYNKTFGYINHLNISVANTTQILDTAKPADLFRICKANGLQDSFYTFGTNLRGSGRPPCSYLNKPAPDIAVARNWLRGEGVTHASDNSVVPYDNRAITLTTPNTSWCAPGVGSVIRLIPGTDIVIPDQQLIPGSNANSIVFQVEADFTMPEVPAEYENKFALWILFEYVGVATITPGQCQITMNPLGNGAVMTAAPIVTQPEDLSTTEGSGWLDKIKNVVSNIWNASGLKEKAKEWKPLSTLASTAASFIPGVGSIVAPLAGNLVNKLTGYGESAKKRPRISGGAQMGLGDFC